MNGEREITGDFLWGLIPPKTQEDWAVHQVCRDGRVREVLSVLAREDFGDPVTRDICLDELERRISEEYGIPPERCEYVFRKVEGSIKYEQARKNGET